jgi:predicted AlkP superfamily phosphohydrolase/phosphomutase
MRVLIIGIDGGTFDVLNPLMQSGQMPHLATLMQAGAHGELRSTLPPITGPAWRAFATGCNPGKHGVIDFVELDPVTRQVHIKDVGQSRLPTFWDDLSAAGHTVAVMGVPMTYPPTATNGIVLTGLMTPPGTDRFCHPAELAKELASEGLRWPTSEGEKTNAARVRPYLQALIADMKARVDTACHILATRQPTMATFVFGAADPLQHQFYHALEEGHPQYPYLVDFYTTLDEGIGRLLAHTTEETLVLVVSDHGFGRLHGFIHLNNWLIERGYLALKRDPLTRLRWLGHRMGYTPENIYQFVRRLGIDPRRSMNRGRVFNIARLMFLSFANVDWERTTAFALGHIGQVYLSPRKGASYSDYQALVTQLRADLFEMTHPKTGEYLIEAVHHRDEIYDGPYIDKAPDLVIEPRGYEHVAFGESAFASNHIVGPSLHTGHHRMEGVLIMHGPGVERTLVNGAHILDIAPTVLHRFGLGIPSYMDGSPLTRALTTQYAEAHPVKLVERTLAPETTDGSYTPEEEALVRKRLEDLGYTA